MNAGMRNNIRISLSMKILSIAGWTSQADAAVLRATKTMQSMAKTNFIRYGLTYCNRRL